MLQLGLVKIGGAHGGRPSVFSTPISDQFRSTPSMGGLFSSYSDQQYYNMAKAAVTSFDQLNQRVRRISDKAARDVIIKNYGMEDARPGDMTLNNASLNQRNQVKGWLDKADATGDPGDGFADDGAHGRHRADRLISLVKDISGDVQDAETTYGMLPAPVEPSAQPSAQPAATNWTLPVVVVGGAAVIAAALLGAFK